MKLRKEVLVNREYELHNWGQDEISKFVFNRMGGDVYFFELYDHHSGVIFQRFRNKTYIIPIYFYPMDCTIKTGEGVILKVENPNISEKIWKSIKHNIWVWLTEKVYQNEN